MRKMITLRRTEEPCSYNGYFYELGGNRMGKIVDAHAHAYGEYLTSEKIKQQDL